MSAIATYKKRGLPLSHANSRTIIAITTVASFDPFIITITSIISFMSNITVSVEAETNENSSAAMDGRMIIIIIIIITNIIFIGAIIDHGGDNIGMNMGGWQGTGWGNEMIRG
jgi:hypothetical protein